MEVIANKQGFSGGRIRQIGEKFDVPDGSKASWFAPSILPEQGKPKEKPGKKPDAPDLV